MTTAALGTTTYTACCLLAQRGVPLVEWPNATIAVDVTTPTPHPTRDAVAAVRAQTTPATLGVAFGALHTGVVPPAEWHLGGLDVANPNVGVGALTRIGPDRDYTVCGIIPGVWLPFSRHVTAPSPAEAYWQAVAYVGAYWHEDTLLLCGIHLGNTPATTQAAFLFPHPEADSQAAMEAQVRAWCNPPRRHRWWGVRCG